MVQDAQTRYAGRREEVAQGTASHILHSTVDLRCSDGLPNALITVVETFDEGWLVVQINHHHHHHHLPLYLGAL